MGIEMLASWLPCRKTVFPGVSEFGMQLGVCGELQSSHPKGAFFSTLVCVGGGVAGADVSERSLLPDFSYT